MADSMDFGAQIVRVFGGLFLVLAVLACAVLVMKKLGHYVHKPSVGDVLEVVSRHYLDPKNSLLVVRVYGERFLVGLSPQGLQMLASLKPHFQAPPDLQGTEGLSGAKENVRDDA